jgi:hypothetical protein
MNAVSSPVAMRWLRKRSIAIRAGSRGLLATVLLAACAPTLDWRDVRLPGGLVAQLPCRPGRFERELPVAGRPLRWFLWSCSAGGITYGVATAEVDDAARVAPVLDALARAALAGVRVRDSRFRSFDLAGVTPFSGNVSARILGNRPDGSPIEESLRLFARGTRVFQANALGASLADAAVQPFEQGLRFDLEKREADPN